MLRNSCLYSTMHTHMPPNRKAQQNQPALPIAAGEGERVEGVFSVARVTYANDETGYAVVHLVPDSAATTILTLPATGVFGHVGEGDCLRVSGVMRRDPRYGLQLRVDSVTPEKPQDLQAIERYLAGASIKGLGAHYARVMVMHFGEQTLQVLDTGGAELEQVSGIGPKRAAMIRKSWAEHSELHDLMIQLQGVAQLSPRQAQRVYLAYGTDAWRRIVEDPYRLADDVRGFGFKTCDTIAANLGLAHDAPQRVQAGLLYVLGQALSDGHLWSDAKDLVAQASDLLEVPVDDAARALDELVSQSRMVREEIDYKGSPRMACFLARVANSEARCAETLAFLALNTGCFELQLAEMRARRLVDEHVATQLTDEQRQGVIELLRGARAVVLTGGPGTGKTTAVRALIASLDALGVSYALCATTGRAAKQLAAATGRPAATVHRHLRIGVGRKKVEPIHERVLVIDEASMIDLWLLERILAAMTRETHLFLVGDVDQLPPVGPGAVLQDLIAIGERHRAVAVVRLSRIFRQEAGEASVIVSNCHLIRQGQRPVSDVDASSDYFEMYRETPEAARDLAIELATTRLPAYLQATPNDVQVLAPMHGGAVGIRELNSRLQRALNPQTSGKPELSFRRGASQESVVFRAGDRVRQTRNNYQKRVFNGDLGVIEQIDREERTLTVRYDSDIASYTFDEVDELVHAWAMTVHAAQGSQWPAVIVIMLTSHYIMLDRNILYTALSRAERLAVLVTQDRAIRIAVAQARSMDRRTALGWRFERCLPARP